MNRKLKNEELNRLTEEEYKKAKKHPVTIVLDNVRSMNNVGSIFRTCDAFLISKVYLCGYTPTPPHRDIHKTALGATETVEWEYTKDTFTLIEKLKKEGRNIIGIEQTEESVNLNQLEINTQKDQVIVFGNEVEGVSQKVISLCDICVEVPQEGTKHSLNIAVCAGVVIWEYYTAFKK